VCWLMALVIVAEMRHIAIAVVDEHLVVDDIG